MPVLPHIKTRQLICSANQLTGFYMRATLAFNGITRTLSLAFVHKSGQQEVGQGTDRRHLLADPSFESSYQNWKELWTLMVWYVAVDHWVSTRNMLNFSWSLVKSRNHTRNCKWMKKTPWIVDKRFHFVVSVLHYSEKPYNQKKSYFHQIRKRVLFHTSSYIKLGCVPILTDTMIHSKSQLTFTCSKSTIETL